MWCVGRLLCFAPLQVEFPTLAAFVGEMDRMNEIDASLDLNAHIQRLRELLDSSQGRDIPFHVWAECISESEVTSASSKIMSRALDMINKAPTESSTSIRNKELAVVDKTLNEVSEIRFQALCVA